MAKWSSHYLTKSAEDVQRPVYTLIVCEDWTYAEPGDSYLEDAVGVAETAIQLASDGDFTIENGDVLIIYDKDGFEFIVAHNWDSGTQEITVATRAQYGTYAKAFDRGAVVAKPLAYFATQPISGTTLPFTIGMNFPTGGGQSVDMRECRTTVDDISIVVQDHNADIPRYFKRKPIIGLRAIILAGYEGMVWENFSFMAVGYISDLDISQTNVYEFTVESIMSQLKVKLFGDIEDFDSTLTSTITNVSGTFGLTPVSSAYLNSSAQTMASVGSAWMVPGQLLKAGIVYKIDDEYILSAGGTGSTITVAVDGRGYWNSTAASHTAGAEVDMMFGVEGHPIDILLGLLLTKYTRTAKLNYQKVGDPGHYWDWGSVIDEDMDTLAIGVEFGDIEVQTFHDIRDKWFVDYVFRYKFAKRTDMESFIPKHILNPLGLILYVNRAGKLALAIQQPPLNATPDVLDKSSIIGVPRITFHKDDVVNEVLVKLDHDGEDFQTEVRLIDAESQVKYSRKDQITLEAYGLDSNWQGADTAERMARRKLRPIKDPNPVLVVTALFSKTKTEIGEIILLQHEDLPNVIRGSVGWEDLAMVIGRSPDWEQGALSFEVIDTQYAGQRYCLIAPSGTLDYTAASDTVKATYGFVSDGVTEKMSNGDEGYLVM